MNERTNERTNERRRSVEKEAALADAIGRERNLDKYFRPARPRSQLRRIKL